MRLKSKTCGTRVTQNRSISEDGGQFYPALQSRAIANSPLALPKRESDLARLKYESPAPSRFCESASETHSLAPDPHLIPEKASLSSPRSLFLRFTAMTSRLRIEFEQAIFPQRDDLR